MSVVKGLAAIRQREEDIAARREAANAPKVVWFKLNDGEKAKVRFLQELDEGADGYNAQANVGFVAVEHTSPIAKAAGNFSVRAVCSMADEERCVGCEQHAKDYKAGWKAGSRLYINVLVEDIKDARGNTVDFKAKKDGEVIKYPFVAVLSQGTSAKAVTPALMEYAYEANTITNGVFSVKRNGADFNNTSYLLGTPLKADAEQFDVSPFLAEDADATHKIHDLEKVLRFVSYADQAKFYQLVQDTDGDSGSGSSNATETASTASFDW